MRRTEHLQTPSLTIGGLSDRTGVRVDTIRYYERIGLLPPSPRSRGRHRVFTEAMVAKLTFIRRSRGLGFSIDEIRALLHLASADEPCAAVRKMSVEHLTRVRHKLADLKRLERALARLTEACTPQPGRDCPILAALSRDTRART